MGRDVGALVARSLRESARVKQALLRECAGSIARAAELVIACIEGGHKVMFLGNGGSAADAQHFAAELVGRYAGERRPLPGLALTVDSSVLTSLGNDYGFDHVFARQIAALGQPGDVVVAITTSGSSPNVLAAVRVAKERGLAVIGFTGKKGARFAQACDVAVVAPSFDTARVQECHITAGHLLCEAVDQALAVETAHAEAAKAPARPLVSSSPKELDLPGLLSLRAGWRASRLTVAWTNGAFDVLHAGHVASLRASRALADVLVVGVNTDEVVRRAKGEGRPIFPVAERVETLGALEMVDHVLVFEEPTPERVLSLVQPDVHCKGADYAPPNGAPMPERAVVEAYGGRIEYLPLVPERSTSAVAKRLL